MNKKQITLKSFIQQNRAVDVAPRDCFDFTLADFEQVIIYDFIRLQAD